MGVRFLSTRTHGLLDLLTAGTLLALPRALGWSERVTKLTTNAALGTLGYSLLTRYEFGLLKVLPMEAHLALDAASGAAFCASPLLLADEEPEVKQALAGIGLFELFAALTTRTHPRPAPTRRRIIPEDARTSRQAALGRV
ncbi:MAG: hypothetical protein IRY99_20290, partial [Isosphaeraceae bacterium]|nr:hypothetical protein [Isosphaeraceae bacterium]